jgi:hypothetical protein
MDAFSAKNDVATELAKLRICFEYTNMWRNAGFWWMTQYARLV